MAPQRVLHPFRWSLAVMAVLVTGCQLWPFPLGSENDQAGTARNFLRKLSPNRNTTLGVFLREVGNLVAVGLPTRYGVDVTPYLQVFPQPILPTLNYTVTPNISSARELVAYLSTNQLQIDVTSKVDNTGSMGTGTYTFTAQRTPTGTTGKMRVTTMGTSWYTVQPTTNFVLAQNQTPRVLNSLSVSVTLQIPAQNVGQAAMSADLSQFENTGEAPVPKSVSASVTLNNLAMTLNGVYGGLGSLTLSGETYVGSTKGNDNYHTTLNITNGKVQGTFSCETQKVSWVLVYDQGLFSGTAKALDGRQAILATLTQAAGKNPECKFIDGTSEAWNLTVPN